MAAGLAHSADGIHWTPYNKGKPVTGRAADTYNQILWDGAANRYLLLTREDFGPAGGPDELRGVRIMSNPDVKANPTAWSTISKWKLDNPSRRQIYNLADWIYRGVHFGLAPVYEYVADVSEGTITDHVKRHERDIMNTYLITSRNAVDWDLTFIKWESPLIPRGGDGAFDKDIIKPASQIVTHDDRHWIYYMGADERHGNDEVQFERQHAIGVATVPLDRLIALEAKHKEGTVTTRPFKWTGNSLEVNAQVKSGFLAMEVFGKDGQPIPGLTRKDCQPLQNVDGLRLKSSWNGAADLERLKGEAVRLKFYLQNARLFSFQIQA